MYTLGTYFTELLKNIHPPSNRLDAARDLPPKVCQFLQDINDFDTVYPHTRLAGSYAQHTSVGDVKDVDFLVRVPGDPGKNDPSARDLIRDLKKVLDKLPEALGYTGQAFIDDIKIERARRSVHIYFEEEDFHIDVVPCIAPNGFNEVVYVPDRGFNKWIKTHPVGYIELLRDLDEVHNQKVRPLIKLVKHFRNVHMVYRKPKSYWLGALVVYQLTKKNGIDTSKSLAELFHDFCDAVYKQYDHLLTTSQTATPNIPDPMLDHNISWNWERSHFETFMRRLDEGRKWSANALAAENREDAIAYWQKVFGEEYFPVDISKAATEVAEAGFPGKSYVNKQGFITATNANGVTQVKRTTFHGEI